MKLKNIFILLVIVCIVASLVTFVICSLCAINWVHSIMDFSEPEPESELHHAVSSRDKQEVLKLIEYGADVNAKGDIYGFSGTPLCLAVARGNKDIVEILIKNGADVNIDNPLYIAAGKNNIDIATYLIENGANPNGSNGIGLPIVAAVERGHIEMVELLVDKGASLIKNIGSVAVRSKSYEMIQYLIKKGVDFNTDHVVWTASVDGTMDVFQLLISIGVDFNARLGHGTFSPLHLAAEYGHKPIVEYFIKNGVDVNLRDSHNQTPLHRASKYSFDINLEVVKYLIDNGADINAKDDWNQTPIETSINHNMKNFIIEHSAKLNTE